MLNKLSQAGFTLIEVMAAVAIFAIAASGLYTINQQNILLADRLENKTIAHWIALNEFNRLSLEEKLPDLGNKKEKVEMAGSDWEVSMEISDTSLVTVKRVSVVVSNESGQVFAQLDGFLGSKAPPEQSY